MSETSEMLEQALASIFTRSGLGPAQRGAMWPGDVWSAVEAGGFTYFDLDEGDIGLEEIVGVATCVGRHAVPIPLVETTGLVSWLIARSGLDRPEGLTLSAVAHPLDDLRAEPLPGGDVEISGTLHRVPWGRRADHLVAVADVRGTARTVLLPRPAEVRTGENLAGEPRDTVLFDRVRVPSAAISESAGPSSSELRARGALLRAASAAGAMERVLAMVLAYADTREQFGKPIRTFQAVQHHLVDVAEAAAGAMLAVRAAVLADPGQRLLAAASAAVTAKEDTRKLNRSAHQVLGAIGVTDEHELPAFTTRLWSWQGEFGTSRDWSIFIGRAALNKSLPSLWSLISATEGTQVGSPLGEVVPW
ncbi:acyl-CoA dehydrogenase family protein [Micromonospora sp. NBC_01638]|uniref:acyl-CoA dehydrogenase family protein n=1 Tax=Micromonospora sp. NBC_01638 TaxID=2975982 RepID=UPI00386A7150|nr:acyl-CoA dehydrogenase family protein [Micromonospora sp. NBC_01638]